MHILAKLTFNSCLFRFFFPCVMAGFAGCTAPEVRFLQQAESFGFEQTVVQGTVFKHVAYIKTSVSTNEALHIYLDGDGSAWINHRWVSSNPTPGNTLMLRLMKQDKQTSLYLGRPCYHGFSQISPCTSKLWTSHRYSPVVISTMAAAINDLTKRLKSRHIVLIGHSGGGTLAMLLAEHLSNISGVVTIAANLDINAWTNYHGYLPLSGSLNPAQRKPLGKNVFQLHLAGVKDKNVPISQIRSFTKKQFSAQLLVFDDYDHHCCWEEIWPSILESVDTYGYP